MNERSFGFKISCTTPEKNKLVALRKKKNFCDFVLNLKVA
jgi:hypothetical protein